jgi:hypothetical protein
MARRAPASGSSSASANALAVVSEQWSVFGAEVVAGTRKLFTDN